jgi:hypothetical protein
MSGQYEALVPDGWDDDGTDAALFAENNEREQKLWGDLLPAKRVLQRRGFGVWWADKAKRRINVGEQVVSVTEFKKMAALHKRLSGIK